MTGDEIRELFLSYFEGKGHLRMPSASLVPSGDPTLLFTSAGMVPFKPFFQGEQRPPSRRLTSSQKSFRTTDIDEVGDHTHLTMFEMLGNFSIGDYFKKQAVAWAWEFVTSSSLGFGLEPERFYATVHYSDDEAYELWNKDVGLPPERIYRYGDADNWWGPAGLEGPCGPCSELHYDFGDEFGCGKPMADPSSDLDRGVPSQPRMRANRRVVEPGFHAILPGLGGRPHTAACAKRRYWDGFGAGGVGDAALHEHLRHGPVPSPGCEGLGAF